MRMKRMMMAFLASLLLAAVPVEVAAQAATPVDGASVIYLARHAERAEDHPSDPTLTPEGTARALELARVLADVPLTTIFSTPFRRTRLTAAPIAEESGLEIVGYDPRDAAAMAAFVNTLRTTPGHHFVSGHSNTTPALVEALGGDPVSPIEHDEYDRLYIVTVAPDGTVTSTLLRFGAPYQGHQDD